LNIDFIKSHMELFSHIHGFEKIIDDYDEKVKNAKCSGCTKRKLIRGILSHIVQHIKQNKDMNLLNSLNDDIILVDGKFNKTVSKWKYDLSHE